MTETAEIRIERRGALGILVLDRQHALNALTREMVRNLSRALAAWRDDPAVAAVLVRAAPGRAFCAGGDIRKVIETRDREGVEAACGFFRDEYRMNWRIRNFPKPYIALCDGITMGGGVGISVHGSHRIVTENTLFAMPETGIGFFPDVGGSWFLPRLPGELGMYLGLTGARAKAADCLYAGIATHYLPAERLPLLEEELAATPADRVATVLGELLSDLGERPEPAPAPLEALRARIDSLFAGEDLFTILEALGDDRSGFGAEQLEILAGKSPFSLRVTCAQLRRGARLADFAEALQLEYRIVHRFLEGREFAEGVRALLVDKDRNPKWTWPDPRSVPEEAVEACFAPLPGGDLRCDWEDV